MKKYNWFSLKWMQVKEWFVDQKLKVYNKVKDYVLNRELENWSKNVVYDTYGAVKLIKSNPNFWVFDPVEAVYLTLKLHFNKYAHQFYKLGIFKIDVDTQDEKVDVTISLKRPGLLIGKSGNDINMVTERLRKIFNMPTEIHIIEIKKDDNEPFICY